MIKINVLYIPLQTILFQSHSLQDALAINGTYRAVVSNPYGVNESVFTLQYNCKFMVHSL